MNQLRSPDAGRQQPLGSWALATTLITLLILLVGAVMLQPKLTQRRLNRTKSVIRVVAKAHEPKGCWRPASGGLSWVME